MIFLPGDVVRIKGESDRMWRVLKIYPGGKGRPSEARLRVTSEPWEPFRMVPIADLVQCPAAFADWLE